MKTRFRIDGHFIECSTEPLEGTYFRVSWNLRPIDRPRSAEVLRAESYVCLATTEEEAQNFVQARARTVSGLVLGLSVTVEADAPALDPPGSRDMAPDAPR